MAQGWFVWCGNKANEFEAKMNFRAANPNTKITKDNLYIPTITQDQAFVKGVEYAVELFVLYGLIGALGFYEIQKSIKASKKLEKQFSTFQKYHDEDQLTIERLKYQVEQLQRDLQEVKEVQRTGAGANAVRLDIDNARESR